MYALNYVYSKLTYINVLILEDLIKTCCLDKLYIVKTNVGSYGEVATEEGRVSISLGKILLCGGTSGGYISGWDLDAVSANGKKTWGSTCGVPNASDGAEDE